MATSNPDPTAPLWRAAQVFRLLSCLYALGFQIAINPDLRRPTLGWVLFAVLIGWSGACAIAYLRGFGRKPAWVIAEIVIVVLLMASNKVVTTQHWAAENQTWPTTLWASNPTISAAIQFGPVGGMLTGLAVMATNFAVKNYFDLNMSHNASIIIELAIGMAIGMAAQTARRAHDELQRAAQLSAALEERERLSREVHDGAIQVLALVAKRGHEIGGPTAELADLASEQERALRRWITSAGSDPHGDATTIDLRTLLRRRESDRVSVSLRELRWPYSGGQPSSSTPRWAMPWITLRRARARAPMHSCYWRIWAIRSRSAFATTAWASPAAAGQGRLGISKSIVGRLNSLAGTPQLHSSPGEDTEWELCVPRRGGRIG